MKKKLILAAIALIGVFAACDKENNDNDNSNSDKLTVINITNVIGDVSDVAIVKALMYRNDEYNNEEVVATAEFKNGGSKINLPATVSEKHLNFPWNLPSENMSNKNAKIGYMTIGVSNSIGNEIGRFYGMICSEDDYFAVAYYVYADRKFTIKGDSYPFAYNCAFEKGWNILYVIDDKEISTKKPTGKDFRWVFND